MAVHENFQHGILTDCNTGSLRHLCLYDASPPQPHFSTLSWSRLEVFRLDLNPRQSVEDLSILARMPYLRTLSLGNLGDDEWYPYPRLFEQLPRNLVHLEWLCPSFTFVSIYLQRLIDDTGFLPVLITTLLNSQWIVASQDLRDRPQAEVVEICNQIEQVKRRGIRVEPLDLGEVLLDDWRALYIRLKKGHGKRGLTACD